MHESMRRLWPFERTPNEPRPASPAPCPEGLAEFLERLLPVLNGLTWWDAEALTLSYDAKSLLEDLKHQPAPEAPVGAPGLLAAAIKATRWIGMAIAHNAFADCANPIIAERDLANLEAAIAKAQEEIR